MYRTPFGDNFPLIQHSAFPDDVPFQLDGRSSCSSNSLTLSGSQPSFDTPFELRNQTMTASFACDTTENLSKPSHSRASRVPELRSLSRMAWTRHQPQNLVSQRLKIDATTQAGPPGHRYRDACTQTEDSCRYQCISDNSIVDEQCVSPPTNLISFDSGEGYTDDCGEAIEEIVLVKDDGAQNPFLRPQSATSMMSQIHIDRSAVSITEILGRSQEAFLPAIDAYVMNLRRQLNISGNELAMQSSPMLPPSPEAVINALPIQLDQVSAPIECAQDNDNVSESNRERAASQPHYLARVSPGRSTSLLQIECNSDNGVDDLFGTPYTDSTSSTNLSSPCHDTLNDRLPNHNSRASPSFLIEAGSNSSIAEDLDIVRAQRLRTPESSETQMQRVAQPSYPDIAAVATVHHTPSIISATSSPVLHPEADPQTGVFEREEITEITEIAAEEKAKSPQNPTMRIAVPKATFDPQDDFSLSDSEQRTAEVHSGVARTESQYWPPLEAGPITKAEDQRLEAIERLLTALTEAAPNESRYEFACQMRTIVRLAAAFNVHPCSFGIGTGEVKPPLSLGDVSIIKAETGDDNAAVDGIEMDCARVKGTTAKKWIFRSRNDARYIDDLLMDLVQSLTWRRGLEVVAKGQDDDFLRLTRMAPLSGGTTLRARPGPPLGDQSDLANGNHHHSRSTEALFVNESRSAPEIFNQAAYLRFGKRTLPQRLHFDTVSSPATQEKIWLALLSAANKESVVLEAIFGPEPSSLPVMVRLGDVATKVYDVGSGDEQAMKGQQPRLEQPKAVSKKANTAKAVSPRVGKQVSLPAQPIKKAALKANPKSPPKGPRALREIPAKPSKKQQQQQPKASKAPSTTVSSKGKEKQRDADAKIASSHSDYETAPEDDEPFLNSKARRRRAKALAYFEAKAQRELEAQKENDDLILLDGGQYSASTMSKMANSVNKVDDMIDLIML